nr:hypothetical protein GCM10020185_67350 [Pseudomonas brassicacearum subsp. brassicacearum]
MQYINASRASLIVALNPAVIGLASWWLFKERLSRLKVAGIVLCIGGAGLVIVSRDPSLLQGAAQGWIGDLLIFLAACWAGVSIRCFRKKLNDSLGPLQTVTWSILLGTLMLWLACAAAGEIRVEALRGLDVEQWLSLLYLGVLGSALAYIAWYDGIRRIGATRSGVFIALNPLTAVLLGALLLDERLTALMCVGGGRDPGGHFSCATNPLRGRRKRRFDTEGGQTWLRCVESSYAYKNNVFWQQKPRPQEPWVDNEDTWVSTDLWRFPRPQRSWHFLRAAPCPQHRQQLTFFC